MIKCDCFERTGIKIDSQKRFHEIESYFLERVQKGVFEEILIGELSKSSLYVNTDKGVTSYWYATKKWYRCKFCNCVWEFQYPEFPVSGFVRKYIEKIDKYKE